MSAALRLDRYLDALRERLRRRVGARAALGIALVALVVTLFAALLLRPSEQLPWLLPATRVLGVALAFGALFVLAWRPLRSLREREGAAALEAALPEQAGRVETYLELRRRAAGGAPAPLLDLLAEDAAVLAERETPAARISARSIALPAAAAGTATLAIVALLTLGGAYWGSGARALWRGIPAPATLPPDQRRIDVTPGDGAVRRNQDVVIAATTVGFAARDTTVHLRFADDGEWEATAMKPDADGRPAFTLFALREPVAYYVTAGGLRSREHHLRVVDPPRVEQLRLTLVYPAWTGLKPRTQEDAGDIDAVAGTRVRVEVKTDAPLDAPLLVVDEKGRPLAQQGNVGRGELTVAEPGQYRISARFAGELVALTDNFRIAVTPDEKPTVEIRRPGRDYQASSIEEVPVSVIARDDFRLEGLELRYAVNGGAWKSEPLDASSRDINAAALLRLEELRQSPGAPLVPGDIVSYYAVARDHHSAVQTDLFLIQVQPFDRRYTQSQAAGGGGGGGGGEDDGKISERQREILMATFNLSRDAKNGAQTAERISDNAAMLADLEKTLAEQARTLVARANARELTGAGADENVARFVRQLEEASEAMKPAADKLQQRELEAALSDEQRALQHLLRAEASFRDIQVAMQSGSRGGGGGGRGSASRDVSEMTALELDLEKNQYETESQLPAAAAAESEDEALRRLRELARRQEQLAREQARQQVTPEAQRWQQDQLRREAEDLRQRLEQLAQQQGGSQQQGSPQQGSSPQRGGQQGSQQGGRQSGAQQGAAGEALAQMDQALRAMREGRAGADRSLKAAAERLERGRQDAVGERFGSLARGAGDVLRNQQRSEEALRAAVAGGRNLNFEQAEQLAERKRELQAGLEALQMQMQAARQQGARGAPDASARVGAAARKLDEDETAARIARSAIEIDRGRGTPALARDSLITESLKTLQQDLAEAARIAAGEAGQDGGQPATRPQDLLAELGDLRRALQRAQQQAGGAQQGGSQQDGQQGGQQGGQAGGRAGTQGGGALRDGGFRGGGYREDSLQPGGYTGGDWRESAQRLDALGQRLGAGALSGADVAALRELTGRLRRGGRDPLVGETARLETLVSQLELAALHAAPDAARDAQTRADLRGSEPARYRDKVAEYYRRLGSP
jgi:hypothetical protein